MRPYLSFIIAIALFVLADGILAFTPLSRTLDIKIQAALQYEMEQLAKDNPRQLDTLFLGSSRTQNGFDTAYFENAFPPSRLNAYNMGVATGDYLVFYLTLDSLVRQYGKPKLVLLETAHFLFKNQSASDNNIHYYRTLINTNPSVFRQIVETPLLQGREKTDIFLTYLSGMYRYRSVIGAKALVKQFWRSLSRRAQAEAVPLSLAEEANRFQQEANHIASLHLEGFTQVNDAKLELFLQYCHQQNIPVVLVQWPTHPAYGRLMQQSPIHKPYREAVQRLAQKYHVTFLDFSQEEATLDRSFYLDSSHLSHAGARLFTQKLVQALRDAHLPPVSSASPALR